MGRLFMQAVGEVYEFNQSLKVTEEKTRIRVVTPNEIAVYERPMTAVTSASRQVKQRLREFTEYAIMPNYPIANNIGLWPRADLHGEKKADFECVSSLIDLAYTKRAVFPRRKHARKTRFSLQSSRF